MWQFVVAFRNGWRWPFRANDRLEVWDETSFYGELSGELVCQILAQFMSTAILQRQVGARLKKQPLPSLRSTCHTLDRKPPVRAMLAAWKPKKGSRHG